MKATTWKNADEKGTFHSVRFSRTWQDGAGNYRDGDSFGGAELLRLAHPATRAYDELARLRTPDEEDADQ